VPGGHFIGTIPNSNWIIKKLRNSASLSFGNNIYEITFDSKDTHSPIFGHKYSFSLEDAIDGCPEFLIHIPTLISICKKNRLNLVFITPFHQYFERNCRRWGNLLERMNVLPKDGPFPDEDWEAAGIYMAFSFIKV
jgi:mRNA (guanine-N7-)-methyltransferase